MAEAGFFHVGIQTPAAMADGGNIAGIAIIYPAVDDGHRQITVSHAQVGRRSTFFGFFVKRVGNAGRLRRVMGHGPHAGQQSGAGLGQRLVVVIVCHIGGNAGDEADEV